MSQDDNSNWRNNGYGGSWGGNPPNGDGRGPNQDENGDGWGQDRQHFRGQQANSGWGRPHNNGQQSGNWQNGQNNHNGQGPHGGQDGHWGQRNYGSKQGNPYQAGNSNQGYPRGGQQGHPQNQPNQYQNGMGQGSYGQPDYQEGGYQGNQPLNPYGQSNQSNSHPTNQGPRAYGRSQNPFPNYYFIQEGNQTQGMNGYDAGHEDRDIPRRPDGYAPLQDKLNGDGSWQRDGLGHASNQPSHPNRNDNAAIGGAFDSGNRPNASYGSPRPNGGMAAGATFQVDTGGNRGNYGQGEHGNQGDGYLAFQGNSPYSPSNGEPSQDDSSLSGVMDETMALKAKAMSVTEAMNTIKGALNQAFPGLIYVHGEIADLSRSSKGHTYFSIKDDSCGIKCVHFKRQIPEGVKVGSQVVIIGTLSVYAARGDVQIIADKIIEVGLGEYFRRLQMLKQRLKAEGLFEESHKKYLPYYPRVIGIFTSGSKDARAKDDVINKINEYFPSIKVIIYSIPVQGKDAGVKIAERLYEIGGKPNECDVYIIARGGGGIEDLMPFNEEVLARAVYDFPYPVISAVGHQGDFSICDDVCDMRAATPTDSADKAIPFKLYDLENLVGEVLGRAHRIENEMIGEMQMGLERADLALENFRANFVNIKRMDIDNRMRFIRDKIARDISFEENRLADAKLRLESLKPRADFLLENVKVKERILHDSMRRRLDEAQYDLDGATRHLEAVFNPDRVLKDNENLVANMEDFLQTTTRNMLASKELELAAAMERLRLCDPGNILKRGYSYVTNEEGKVVSSVESVQEGDSIDIKFADGDISARVERIEPKG